MQKKMEWIEPGIKRFFYNKRRWENLAQGWIMKKVKLFRILRKLLEV